MNHLVSVRFPALQSRSLACTFLLGALFATSACGGSHKVAESPSSNGNGRNAGGYATATVASDSDGSGSYASSESAPADKAPSSYGDAPSPSPAPVAATPIHPGAATGGTIYAPPATKPSPGPKYDAPSKESKSKSVASDSAGSYSPPPVAKTPIAPGAVVPSAAPTVVAKGSVVISTTTTTTIPGGGYAQESPSSGVLTAAIWDDNSMRASFLSFLDRYPTYGANWGIDLKHRVTIRVEDSNGVLVGDVPLALRTPDGSIVNLRTHGDGTALFYPKLTMAPSPGAQGQSVAPTYSIAAQSGTLRTETAFSAPAADATWTVKLAGIPSRAKEPALDVAFVVDCTGSMGDEITYLQTELANVVKTVKTQHSMRRVRLGLVLYRDRGDDFVTKSYPFTEDLGVYLNQLKTAQAAGGGDMPESVNAALADTVSKLSWAGDETGRLAILVGDAPPHYYADEQYTYKNAIVDLSSRGVKLVTLGASGIDKSTEYVFRQMSAFTGGRYIFLTDDSGVGDSHLTPDISGFQVEHLDKILVRVIGDEAKSFKR